ncbi:MAG: alpha-ketoglutarate-dependent dioxygenase AlkB [Acidimicrobiales bacterium]
MAFQYLDSDLFAYDQDFLPAGQHAELLAFLQAVPRVTPEARAAATSFVLAPPVADGTTVAGRLEGAAGQPVWTGVRPGVGVAIPPLLARLATMVNRSLGEANLWARAGEPPAPFSSVYVDRYPRSGTFMAHTDRDCYGAVVVGVSIGPGSCTMHFEIEGQAIAFALHPGSLYVFAGSLRRPPYTHRVDSVSDERFGVTFRSTARAQSAAP